MKTCSRCDKPTSFWQRTFGGGLCSECSAQAASEEETRRRAADEERLRERREAARVAEEKRQQRLAHRNRCTVCGSILLKAGYVPDSGGNALTGGNRMRFKTDIFEANQLQVIACMNCGHVSFWIHVEELPS